MKSLHLIVVAEAVSSAGPDGCAAVGQVLSDEGLIHILPAQCQPGRGVELVGRILPGAHSLGHSLEIHGHTWTFVPRKDLPPVGSHELVTLDELDARRAGILGKDALREKKAGFLGLGSLASPIVLEWVKAGVQDVRLADIGRFDMANVSRHVGDLRSLGRLKTDILAEELRCRGASPVVVTEDLSQSDAALDQFLAGLDLLVVCTDAQRVQFCGNDAAERNRVPTLFPQAYERGVAGECFLYRPGSGPCLYCWAEFRSGITTLQPTERRRAYQASDANDLSAEPGLGADLAYISAVATAIGLAVLDPTGSRASLLESGHPLWLIHGGSTPRQEFAQIFHRPFEVIPAQITRDEPCPVCGYSTKPQPEGSIP